VFLRLFIRKRCACLIVSIKAENSTILYSENPWLRLPATPQLPFPNHGQYAAINGIQIWYIIYDPNTGTPLLFIHGGFANSNYWASQIQQLKSVYRCIFMDSRGQRRSTMSSTGISYDLMKSDAIALLDYLGIQKIHLIGWSDGAIIGLNIAMNYPNRLS
jgi:pimeloyl-ACP methyl ester carboxylesterase